MKSVLYLPGFTHRMHGGRVARAAQRLACPRLDGFSRLAGRFLPKRVFDALDYRDRVYTPWVTFCGFLSQVLQRDCGCKEDVMGVEPSPPRHNGSKGTVWLEVALAACGSHWRR